MNESIISSSWGWFLVWLKENFYSEFTVQDDGREFVKIKILKTNSKNKIIGYHKGEDIERMFFQEFITYCNINYFYQEIKDIGAEKYNKMIEDKWKDMMTVVTIENDGLKIKKVLNFISGKYCYEN